MLPNSGIHFPYSAVLLGLSGKKMHLVLVRIDVPGQVGIQGRSLAFSKEKRRGDREREWEGRTGGEERLGRRR